MRDEMQRTLDATRQARQDAVHQLRGNFAEARLQVSKDLRGAADAWRAFAAGRGSPADPQEPPPHRRHTAGHHHKPKK
jgi:hypothetical protein